MLENGISYNTIKKNKTLFDFENDSSDTDDA